MGIRLPPRARSATFVLASVVAVSTVVLACNALSGIGDLTVDDGDGGIGPESLSEAGAAIKDAGPDIVIDPPGTCPSAGRSCVKVAPPGWDGPLVVFDEASKGEAPTCPSSMALARVDGHAGQPTGGLTCTPCSCGPVTGSTCSGTIKFFAAENCTGFALKSGPLTEQNCVTSISTVDSMSIETTVMPGSCAPDGGVPQAAAVVWPQTLRGCGAPTLLTDGCKSGEVCAPDPPNGFRARHCISKAGDVACPDDTWSVKRSGFTGVNDSRTCSKCSCNAPSGVVCTGSVQSWGLTGQCSGPSSNIALPLTNPCRTATSDSAARLNGALDAGNGACTPTSLASTPSGTVANKDPVTVCCLP